MKKTLQDQYLLIKEGKGHKGVFLTEAKRQFPDLIPNNADVKLTAQILKDKNIINENIVGLQSINQMIPTKKESFETAFETFLKEAKKKEETDKAEAKTVSKSVEEKQEHAHDNTDEKNIDNVIFDQVMMGYYAELKDPKNADKTMEELKAIVLKNLAKDPIHYTKDGQFGIKGLGYETEHPGLGTPKEAKGKYASSGYGNLNENKQPMSLNESKLRNAIRAIIREEIEEVRGGGNYGILTINTSNTDKGEQKIPSYFILTPEVRKAFNLLNPGPNAASFDESLKIPHIRVTPSNTIFISDLLYVTLEGIEKGKGTREKQVADNKNRLKVISNEIQDQYWPMIRGLFKKFANPKTTVYPVLGKDVLYHEVDFESKGYEVEKLEDWVVKKLKEVNEKLARAESGEVRRGRPLNVAALSKFKLKLEQLQSSPKGGMVIVAPPLFENTTETDTLNENVHKRLKEIDTEVQDEVTQSKLSKIMQEIEKRKAQLTMIDENEDLRELTDKSKVKALQKEIKLLEKAQAKLEKAGKGKKKEVLDEADEPSQEYLDAKSDAEARYNEGEDIESIMSDYPQFKNELYQDIIGGFEGSDY
jgi:hypothetical protein